MTRPLLGFKIPSRTLIKVDLPAPLGPIKVTISFSCRAKSTFLIYPADHDEQRPVQVESKQDLASCAALLAFPEISIMLCCAAKSSKAASWSSCWVRPCEDASLTV